MLYYFAVYGYDTVSKKPQHTRVVSYSDHRCQVLSEMLRSKFGPSVVLGSPCRVTPQFFQDRSRVEASRAGRILDLIVGARPR